AHQGLQPRGLGLAVGAEHLAGAVGDEGDVTLGEEDRAGAFHAHPASAPQHQVEADAPSLPRHPHRRSPVELGTEVQIAPDAKVGKTLGKDIWFIQALPFLDDWIRNRDDQTWRKPSLAVNFRSGNGKAARTLGRT